MDSLKVAEGDIDGLSLIVGQRDAVGFPEVAIHADVGDGNGVGEEGGVGAIAGADAELHPGFVVTVEGFTFLEEAAIYHGDGTACRQVDGGRDEPVVGRVAMGGINGLHAPAATAATGAIRAGPAVARSVVDGNPAVVGLETFGGGEGGDVAVVDCDDEAGRMGGEGAGGSDGEGVDTGKVGVVECYGVGVDGQRTIEQGGVPAVGDAVGRAEGDEGLIGLCFA